MTAAGSSDEVVPAVLPHRHAPMGLGTRRWALRPATALAASPAFAHPTRQAIASHAVIMMGLTVDTARHTGTGTSPVCTSALETRPPGLRALSRRGHVALLVRETGLLVSIHCLSLSRRGCRLVRCARVVLPLLRAACVRERRKRNRSLRTAQIFRVILIVIRSRICFAYGFTSDPLVLYCLQ